MEYNIKVRKAAEEDLDFVYRSICELEDEILDFEVFKAIFLENITNPHINYFLAEKENKRVGFISFHTQKLLHHCGLVGEIQEFFINKNYRNQGIGRELIQTILQFAREQKLKSIEVTTNRRRVENVQIYENLGFTLTHNKFTIL